MFVNVSSRFSADWTASSSMPDLRLIAVARSPICFAVTFAAPPVDFRTVSVCLPTASESV
jgi:hypothetical protein